MAMRRGNPLFGPTPQRPTPSSEIHPQPLPPKGGEWNAQGRSQGVRPRVGVLQQGRGEACVRLQGPCLVPALRQCSTAFPSPVCTRMLGERQLCIMHYALER